MYFTDIHNSNKFNTTSACAQRYNDVKRHLEEVLISTPLTVMLEGPEGIFFSES